MSRSRTRPVPTRPGSSRARREQQRRQQRRRQQQRRARRLVGLGVAVLLALVAGAAVMRSQSRPSATSTRPATLLASANQPSGAPIDGIQCLAAEQVVFHVHAHLAVYVNGQARGIPAGIGIKDAQVQNTPSGPVVAVGSCFYWLHAHTADGIIHIESPVTRPYTLGDYFDIWGQPLGHNRVGPATGTVIAYLNGVRYSGDPRTISLTAHARIQLAVGRDVSPKPFVFPAGL